MAKEALFGKLPGEIKEITARLGLPAYAAVQITEWLYKKHAVTYLSSAILRENAGCFLRSNFRGAYREWGESG